VQSLKVGKICVFRWRLPEDDGLEESAWRAENCVEEFFLCASLLLSKSHVLNFALLDEKSSSTYVRLFDVPFTF